MMTDPIADMLTRLRNAARAGHDEISLPGSKLKLSVIKVLQQAGYVSHVQMTQGVPQTLTVGIVYRGKTPVLQEVTRTSKPGRRVYVGWDKIPRVKNGYGLAIISTPRGVMAGHEARKQKLGGELICTVS